MKEIQYIGENIWIGNLGKFFVALSLVASIFACLSYFINSSKQDKSWLKMGRTFFGLHFVGVLGIVGSLFYIIFFHHFEYYYAWQHSSKDLPLRYIVSCFWEGQEGSFLLWMFWHAILGLIFITRKNPRENHVMAVVSLAQIVLSVMLLGQNILGMTLGSSPFELLRVLNQNAPIFQKADYLQYISGTGLNPLLQNYWMVIHPPVLFLGFASAIFPFAFAVSEIWKKQGQKWVNAALPYSLFSVTTLGTGIIMGGIWAYESLSFGGYWAWDPVENASLIPWLVIIAAVHLMLIHKSTGKSGALTLIFNLLSFLLVLYATFLTRSGILGDTSVHSFTDLGLSGQLLTFVFVFGIVPILFSFEQKKYRWLILAATLILFVVNVLIGRFLTYVNLSFIVVLLAAFFFNLNQRYPSSNQKENLLSREFWMLVGSLVLILSAFQVWAYTSLPVFNKMFGTNYSIKSDIVSFYNSWQIWFAAIICLLMAIGQFFRFKKSKLQSVLANILVSLISALLLTIISAYLFKINEFAYLFLIFTAVYAMAGNIHYAVIRKNLTLFKSGASIAHFGFGLMIVGIVVSGTKKHIISENNVPDTEMKNTLAENITLFKNLPTRMQNYVVTYLGDSLIGEDHYYKVNYQPIGSDKSFNLYPNAQISENMGLVPNPDTKHYITFDLFTHVSSVPIDEEKEWKKPVKHLIDVGDTIKLENGIAILQSLDRGENLSKDTSGHQLLTRANIKYIGMGETLFAKPVFDMSGGEFKTVPVELEDVGVVLAFQLHVVQNEVKIALFTQERPVQRKYIVMKAIIFPYINLVWGGVIFMVFGFIFSLIYRIKQQKKSLA